MKTFLIWAALCITAVAQEESLVSVRVRTIEQDRVAMGAGTGCIVKVTEDRCPDTRFSSWRKAMILTARHVVDDNVSSIRLHLKHGETTNASIVSIGKTVDDDVAMLSAYIPEYYKAVPIAEDDVVDGEVHGYGLGGNASVWPQGGFVRVLPGKLITDEKPVDEGSSMYTMTVRRGDSGGPVIFKGKVIGLITGGVADGPGDTDFTPTFITNLKAIRFVVPAHQR